MKNLILSISIVLCTLCSTQVEAQQALYVSTENGNNRNDGSKSSSFKNIRIAVEIETDVATIYVAQGNYYGLNTFRSAMEMNQVGTMQSLASMFANRYPWHEALQLFGAMDGYGAQKIKN